jgi:hypothetical protein
MHIEFGRGFQVPNREGMDLSSLTEMAADLIADILLETC